MTYTHRGFQHPLGGVSPVKQEEEKKKEKKEKFAYLFDEEKKDKQTKTAKAITDFLVPQNQLELALSAVGGIGTGGGKIGTKLLTKTGWGKKLVSKIPGLNRLLKPVTSTTKTKKGFDFSKKNDYSGGGKPKGGVDGGSVNPEWSKGAGRLNNPGKEGITTQMQGMVNQGKELDKMGYKASEMLNNKNIVFHGDPTKSGRITVEVALPNGQTQMFYKSSGLAGKSGRGVGGTTEGMWQPFMGYSDEVPTGWVKNKAGDYVATGTAKANNWHIKSPGYEDFYGSKSYRDIAGKLDKIAAEEGWDMTGQLLKSNQ